VDNAKFYEGRLTGFAEGNVKLAVRDKEVAVPFAGICKANLVVEI
jgi:ribosome maturation factor RimP